MTPRLHKGLLSLIVGAPLVLSTSATLAHDEFFIGTLSEATEGTHLTPPSAGTGPVKVTINADTLVMRVEATFSGLTGVTSAAHIHCCTPTGLEGFAGVATQTPSFTTFPLGVREGSMDQTFDMSLAASWNPAYVTANGGTTGTAFAALYSGLLSGNAYFNVHTTAASGGVPGGEIRSFLIATPVPEPETYALLLAGLGLVGWSAARRRKH